MTGAAGAPDSSFPGPHRYPFRFVDRVATDRDDRPLVEISGGAVLPGWTRAEANDGHAEGRTGSAPGSLLGTYPLTLLVEIMAQGALAALAAPGEDDGGEAAAAGGRDGGNGGPVHLAGIDGAVLHSRVVPGDRLRVETRVEKAYGRLAKVACRLDRNGETVAEAGLLLAMG